MAFITCRHFFCCLPLRVGVWFLAFFTVLLGGTGAVGSFVEIRTTAQNPIPFLDQMALFVQAGAFSLMAIISLFGFVSGVMGNRGGVFIFSRLAFLDFAISLCVLGVVLFSTFRPITDAEFSNCLAGSRDQLVLQFCSHGWSMVKSVPIILLGTSLPALIYSFVISINFTEKSVVDEVDLWSAGFSKLTPDVEDGRIPDLPWEIKDRQ